MTLETKREIAELYADKSNKAHDIAKSYGVSSSRLAEIITEMGGKVRKPRKKTGGDINKKCPQCRAKIAVQGARFCPFCGADIRNARELLADRLEQVWANAEIVGGNITLFGDESRDVILETIAYLKSAK